MLLLRYPVYNGDHELPSLDFKFKLPHHFYEQQIYTKIHTQLIWMDCQPKGRVELKVHSSTLFCCFRVHWNLFLSRYNQIIKTYVHIQLYIQGVRNIGIKPNQWNLSTSQTKQIRQFSIHFRWVVFKYCPIQWISISQFTPFHFDTYTLFMLTPYW